MESNQDDIVNLEAIEVEVKRLGGDSVEGAGLVAPPATPAKKKASPSKTKKKAAPAKTAAKAVVKEVIEEMIKADPPPLEVKSEVKQKASSAKAKEKVYIVSPKKEGEAKVATQEVMLVVGNSVVAMAAQAQASEGVWEISMGQVDKLIGVRLLQPLSEGRSPDPRYSKMQIELYLLGGVKKRLSGVCIKEFQGYAMLNGRLVVIKASGTYSMIEDSSICPYPIIASLSDQFQGSPIPAQVSLGGSINGGPQETGVLLY
jgi:hypothetical protein